MKSVDVIIPTYKPDKRFFELIEMLEKQTIPVQKIIIMNTEEKYYNQIMFGSKRLEKFKNIKVYHISKKEFDHGRTRDQGIKRSEADFFLCMTHDAIPKDEYLLEELIKGMENEGVAVAYARQVPEENATEAEKFSRTFNYPEEAVVKFQKDVEHMGIKTYFCSNVCAMYNRHIYNQLGGFNKHTIFNEDMIYAGKAVQAGYGIAYVPSAKVIHSHHYTNKEQFSRNFDIGISQADHPEIFQGISSESEGITFVKATVNHLKNKKQYCKIIPFFISCGYKWMGFRLGKRYRKLPERWVMKFTMNKQYWKYNSLVTASAKIDVNKGYGKSEEEKKR